MSQELFAYSVAGLCLVAVLAGFNLWLGFAAAWLLGVLGWRRAERFLNGLKSFAERISRRDFGARVLPAESGSLAGAQLALEAMAFDLKLAFEQDALDRHQLKTALSGIQDGVLLLDASGRLLFANPSLERTFQAELAQKHGVFYWEIFRDAQISQALAQVLEGKGSLMREISLGLSDGDRTMAMSATALQDGSGSRTGVLALFYDRTEQKKLEKMRSEFAANVSHELRTPLTAIKAALETLKDGALGDPTVNRSFLDKAVHHTERLQELISDLLALATVEEDRRLGRVDKSARASLEAALGEARAFLEAALKRSEGTLEWKLPEGMPKLGIEASQLRQVLINLIENALKYSGPKPSPRVGAKPVEGAWELWVEDAGPGIPMEDLPRVFERFYRVDKARARQDTAGQGGSGLGLAIVKHLVENYGGQVGVENLPEKGCRFWFRLPTPP
jgi:two-component system phosphate regulon sensor histidine kinase PhoR